MKSIFLNKIFILMTQLYILSFINIFQMNILIINYKIKCSFSNEIKMKSTHLQ